MIILAFDCSSSTMAAAIGTEENLTAEKYLAENRNHAPYLMPSIHEMFEKASCKPEDVDLIGVTTGPGSFTGLRIGLATAKGFADFLNVPLVPISSLEALARNGEKLDCDAVVPIMDARKGQVYAAVFKKTGDNKLIRLMSDSPLNPLEDLEDRLAEFDKILFVGDAVKVWQDKLTGFYGDRATFAPSDSGLNGIRGEVLYNMTVEAPESSYTDSSIMPVYLRGIDARAKFADFKFRSMNRDDLPELLEIEKSAFKKAWTRGMFINELKNEQARYFVLDYDGRTTAYGGFWLICGECHITNIAVHGDYRNIGQGSAMLDHLIKTAMLYGCHAMTLEVRPSNRVALNLYESRGFVKEGQRKAYYEDGEDAVIMWLRFPDNSDEKPWNIQE